MEKYGQTSAVSLSFMCAPPEPRMSFDLVSILSLLSILN